MMITSPAIVFAIVTLLFAVPLLGAMVRVRLFQPFSFGKLVKSFNYALLSWLFMGLASILTLKCLESRYYQDGIGTDITDVLMATGTTFLIIGAFYFIPVCIGLNLINVVVRVYRRKSKRR